MRPTLHKLAHKISRKSLKALTLPSRTTGWTAPFFRLAAANTLSNLMVPLAGLVDTAFLGHLSDIRYLNGVALATVIFNVIYWSFNFFRMGTTGPTAQAVGQANETEVWLIVIRNACLAVGVGLGVWLLKAPIAGVGFSLLQAGPEAKAAALDFYNGRILDAPAVLVNYVLLGWLLGRAKGRQVVLLAVVGNFSNIFLDYWFIRGLGWGSYGAGLATALSQYLTLVAALIVIFKGGANNPVPWHLWPQIKSRLWQPAALKALFNLNRDILVRTFALVMAMSLFTNFSAGMGDRILGVNTLLIQIVLMAAYLMDGIALAVESYAGNFYGQRATDDLGWLLLFGGLTSMALGVVIALVLMLWPTPFFSMLTSHKILLDQIPTYVGWLLPVLGWGGVAFTLDGYFLGLTAGRTLRNATLIAAFLGFLPLAVIASHIASAHLLWLAMTGLMAMRAILLSQQILPTLGPNRSL